MFALHILFSHSALLLILFVANMANAISTQKNANSFVNETVSPPKRKSGSMLMHANRFERSLLHLVCMN